MTGHLSEAKSSDPLQRQLSLNRLNVFMMVLSKIQDVYSSATFIHGLFSRAIEKITAPGNTFEGQVSTTDHIWQSQDFLGIPIDPSWEFDFEIWDTMPEFRNMETVSWFLYLRCEGG